jgi:1-acyl-sn-glycerol-3-phosphate acyltransferase
LLYYIVKPIIRFALLFFCRKTYLNTKQYLNEKGPLLLAVNHPNSFLDAVIIGCLFKEPVYFLARGDAFKKKWALKILTSLKCIPVYRLREGKENLHLNEDTFEKCRSIFKQKGIVLIFSEGLCINEYNIRPLKKGTARLAMSSWALKDIDAELRILPIGINYSSFNRLPKTVWVNFGEMIFKKDINLDAPEGFALNQINEKIKTQLDQYCFDGVANTLQTNNLFSLILNNASQLKVTNFTTLKCIETKVNSTAKMFTFIPAITSVVLTKSLQQQSLIYCILLFPFALPALLIYYTIYYGWRKFIWAKTKGTGHYDSILFSLNTLFFVLFQPLIIIVFFLITKNLNLALLIVTLLVVSTYILTKFIVNWQRFCNFNRLTSEQRTTLTRLITNTN